MKVKLAGSLGSRTINVHGKTIKHVAKEVTKKLTAKELQEALPGSIWAKAKTVK